jgi:hypothetical protein
MTKKIKMTRLSKYEDNFIKYVILGNSETNGDFLASAIVIIKQP